MISLKSGSLDKLRSVRTLVAALLAISAVAAGACWASQGVSQAGTLSADAGRFIVSICIANPEAKAMRQWIAQHPKSPRGRLDHRRLNAATAG